MICWDELCIILFVLSEREHKLARVEMVSYRVPDVVATSYDFIRKFARHSGAYGIWDAKAYIDGIKDIVENQKPKPFRLSAPGVDLYFSGVIPPIPKMEDGELIFEAPDLGFAILPNNETLNTISGPARKNHLQQIADAVMAEMKKSHSVDIHRNPNFITFPNPFYGRVDTYKVPLL